jgi:hypothetical protein
MTLRDEIDRIVTFEASESPVLRNALMKEWMDLTPSESRDIFVALFTLSRGLTQALYRLADEIDKLRSDAGPESD